MHASHRGHARCVPVPVPVPVRDADGGTRPRPGYPRLGAPATQTRTRGRADPAAACCASASANSDPAERAWNAGSMRHSWPERSQLLTARADCNDNADNARPSYDAAITTGYSYMNNPESGESQPGGLRKTLGSAAAVIAPLTAISALLYFVGWERTRSYFSHFGINTSQTGYSPQDYVVQSGEVGFGLIVWIVAGYIALLSLDRLLGFLLRRTTGRPIHRWLRLGLVVMGVTLAVVGLAEANGNSLSGTASPLTGATLLAVGPVVMARFAPRPLGMGGDVIIIVLVALAGFWGATIYARDIGEKSAAALDANPGALTVVTVYSEKPLDLPGTFVEATRVPVGENEWRYRYTGAGLLTYANERWFLVTNPATAEYHSSVVILHETDSIHVETSVPIRR